MKTTLTPPKPPSPPRTRQNKTNGVNSTNDISTAPTLYTALYIIPKIMITTSIKTSRTSITTTKAERHNNKMIEFEFSFHFDYRFQRGIQSKSNTVYSQMAPPIAKTSF